MATTSSGTVTLRGVENRWPSGTSVSAYHREAKQPDARPSGTAFASATVQSDGTVGFTGLPDCRRLVGHALVNGVNQYLNFSTWPAHGK